MHAGQSGVEESTPDSGDLIRRGVVLVARLVRAHPWTFAASLLGSICFAVGTVWSATMLGWLTDDIVLPAFGEGEARRSRTTVVVAVVLVTLLRSLGVIARRYFAGMTSYRTRNDLQRSLGDHYLTMPAAELRSAPKGRLLAHVDSDTEVATEALGPLPFTLGVFTLLGVSILALALVDWMLMLVAVAMMPMVAGLNRVSARVTEPPARAVREGFAAVSSVASESFDGALVVKTLGREEAELERFAGAAAQLRDDAFRLGRLRAMFAAALDLVPDLGILTLVLVGAWRVSNGHISTGQLVQAVALFGILVFPLRVIGFFFTDLPASVVAHDRVAAVLAGATAPPRGSARLADEALSVEMHDATVRYDGLGPAPVGERGSPASTGPAPSGPHAKRARAEVEAPSAALDRVTLRVDPGEVVAVVGPTGAGKSTLLMAMADMVPLDAGTVRIGGVATDTISADARTSRVAIAWQEPFLLDASVRANIAFGADLDDQRIAWAAEVARFGGVARDLPEGYDTRVGERGVLLSGGQRQRLALARAIVRRPGLLLLDDATSAVDPVIEQQILEGISGLDTTIVIVAHRRSTIMAADRVAMMRNGVLVAVGTHDELSERSDYRSLLEAYDTHTPIAGGGE